MVRTKSATDAPDLKSPSRQANGTYLRYVSIGVRSMEILKSTNREKADLIARLQGASMKLILFLMPISATKKTGKKTSPMVDFIVSMALTFKAGFTCCTHLIQPCHLRKIRR